MSKKFISALLQRRILVIMIVIMTILGGLGSYMTIPKQHFPPVIIPMAAVTVIYPGASADDMETLVCEKVEETVTTLDGFDYCNSEICDNMCTVTIMFDLDISTEQVDASCADLRNKMDDLKPSLPSGVSNIVVSTDLLEVAEIIVAISGDNISEDELTERTEGLKNSLKVVDGIKKVSIKGDVSSQIRVTVNTDKLNMYNISMNDIVSLINAQNSIIPTGDMNINGNDIIVHSSSKFESIDEIKNIIVAADAKSKVITRLSDIADIEKKLPDNSAHYLYNKKRTNLVAVYFEDGINSVSMAAPVRETLDKYAATLPSNVHINEVVFQPDDVQDSVNNFIVNLLESILLVIIVVMIGMNFRNAVVVAFAIPLAIFGNFLVMPIIGVNVQFVSLAALIVVLGMLVDNAVVVSDEIQNNLDKGMDRQQAVIEGAGAVIVPVFISMLTTVSAFAALMTLTGVYRQLAISIPMVIITCLIVSFLVSVIVTPIVSYYMLKTKIKNNETRQDGLLVRTYNLIFGTAFKHKIITFAIAGILLIICAFSLKGIERESGPKAGKPIITIDVKAHNEKSLEETERIVNEIQNILDEQPENEYYLSGVGLGIPRYDFSVSPKSTKDSVGDIFWKINLDNGGRFDKLADLVDYIQFELDNRVGGATILVDELAVMSLPSKTISVEIYSENSKDLNEAERIINSIIQDIPGTKGIEGNSEFDTYSYYVDMNPLKLNTIGLTKAEAQRELFYALGGTTVSTYRNGNKEYDVFLESNINSKEKLEEFKIKASSSGSKFPVNQFADVTLKAQPDKISKIDGRRGRVVGCYCSSQYSSIAIQSKLEDEIEKRNDIPESVTIEYAGDAKKFNEMVGTIKVAAIVSIIIMFIILLIQFGSLKQVGMVFISVPFGIVAGVFALKLCGLKLSFFALIGIISLLGCVLANAIVLIDFINTEIKNGATPESACKIAGAKRVRPICMSTMTTVLGLLPLALFGDALFVPMAVLMMAGLAVSMIINLIFVPIVYYLSYCKN